jgi:hypothetical protein
VKVGDLVRYKNAEFVTKRVYESFVGLVIQRVKDPKVPGSGRVVRVKWNTNHSDTLWHHPGDLEVVNESR